MLISEVSKRFDLLVDISSIKDYNPSEVTEKYISDSKGRVVVNPEVIMSNIHDGIVYYTNHNITVSKRDIIKIEEKDRWITITHIPEIDYVQILLFKGEHEVYRTHFSFYRKNTRMKISEFFAKIRHCVSGFLYYFSDKSYFKEGMWNQLIVDISFGFGSQVENRCNCSFSKMFSDEEGLLNYIVYHKVNKDIRFIVKTNKENRFIASLYLVNKTDKGSYEMFLTSVDNYLFEFSFLDYMVKETLLTIES